MGKKVLIITYYWPPSGGSGVQRWVYMSKYLAELGWTPIILTVQEKSASYLLKDETLNQEIHPNIKVVRTRSFEILRIGQRLFGKKNIAHSGFSNVRKNSWLQKILRFCRGNLFLVDPRKGWNKYAFRSAMKLIKDNDISIVVTTSPPHSTQLIGLKLKQNLSIKWVCDMRDPWTDIYYYKDLFKLKYLKSREEKLEKSVLNEADLVITVGDGLKKIFEHKVLKNRNIFVVENGFENAFIEDDSENKSSSIKLKGEFNILYSGVISEHYNLNPLWEALKVIFSENKNVHMTFVGVQSDAIINTVDVSGMQDNVSFLPYLQKSDLYELYNQADMFLLAIPDLPDNELIITGKIFEYINRKKPVLGIGPVDGDAASIIDKTSTGKIFDYSDTSGIKDFIEHGLEGKLNLSYTGIESYSRKNLTKQLVHLFNWLEEK